MLLSDAQLDQHHAYLLLGPREELIGEVREQCKNASSMSVWEHEVLGIDEARLLSEQQSRKGVGVFVIAFDSITREAQNALLKVLEEPTKGKTIFLIVPQKSVLLPTVLSRLYVVEAQPGASDEVDGLAADFVAAGPAERLTLVAPLIEAKDRGAVQAFLRSLEKRLAQDVRTHAPLLREVLAAKQYAGDRGASTKLLLENLCITI